MKLSSVAVILFLSFCGFIVSFASPRGASFGTKQYCEVVERALHHVRQVKPGSSRADVEKLFVRSSGMIFRNSTRYVYPGCHYIGVDVEFEPDRTVERDFSPSDKVVKVSRLYIDYPTTD